MTTATEDWTWIEDPEKPGTFSAQIQCRPDGLTIRPTSAVREALEALDLLCVHERFGGQPGRGTPTFIIPRPMLNHALDALPPAARAHVERERPDWFEWLVREGALHAERAKMKAPLTDLSGALSVPLSVWLTGIKNLTQTQAEDAPYRKLRAYQRVGIYSFLLAEGRIILGDDMGLGKTAQSLSYCQLTKEVSRLLVVCPSSVTDNWVIEGRTWAPRLKLRTVSSTAECKKLIARGGIQEGEGWILTWGLMARCRELLVTQRFDTVIADEMHNAKESTSQRTRALLELMHIAERRIGLTGTEVRSRIQELWTLLHAVDPMAFPCFKPFGERYCGPETKRVGFHRQVRTYEGASRLPELNQLIRPYVQRRTKEEACPELPPKSRNKLIVRASTQKFYREHDRIMEAIKVEKERPDGGMTLPLLTELRKLVGLAKVPSALDWIEQVRSQDEPCIVFLYHQDVYAELRTGLDKLGVVHAAIVGSTPNKKRQEIKDRFQRGEIDVLVGSEAMKEGITLHRCCYVLHLERWWTPGDEDQGDDRAYRIGQTRPVFAVTLHLANTLDDQVDALLERKRKIVDQVQDRTPIVGDLLRLVRR